MSFFDKVDYYVYTDGSCINNGKKTAKAGLGIYFGPDDPRNTHRPIVGKQYVSRSISENYIYSHLIN